jgi:uncharacterized membrane protein
LCGDILPVAILPTPTDGCHEPQSGFMVIRLCSGGKNAWFRTGLCRVGGIARLSEAITRFETFNFIPAARGPTFEFRRNRCWRIAPMTKTMTFAAVHMSVAFTVGYALSGSALVGGVIALIEPAINTVAYFFHEKLWERIRQQRHTGDGHVAEPKAA